MGVDLGTYRGRIGTFKFAFGNDVVTVNCYINFSRGLKTISAVTFIGVLFLLASTDTWSIQKEHATTLLASSWQMPGSVWFIDMLLLMAGIEPNPGPTVFDKGLRMLMVLVVFIAMFYTITITDSSPNMKFYVLCVALILFAALYMQNSVDGTEAFGIGSDFVNNGDDLQARSNVASVKSKEEQNYESMFCQSTICGFEVLRRFISNKAKTDKFIIDDVIKKHEVKIKRNLHKEYKDVVFPAGVRTNIEEWDFSTTCNVLLFGLKQHLSEEELNAIKSVKRIRNIICHLKNTLLKTKDYRSYNKELQEAIEKLMKPFGESDKNRIRSKLKSYENMHKAPNASILVGISKKNIKGEVMQHKKVLDLHIKLSSNEVDERILKQFEGVILGTCKKVVNLSGSPLNLSRVEKACKVIFDTINDIDMAKIVSVASGSIVLSIEVSTYKALLDTLIYIEGESFEKDVHLMACQFRELESFPPAISVSASLSENTLSSLYSEFVEDSSGILSEANIEKTSGIKTKEASKSYTSGENEGKTFLNLLQKLGLTEKFPGKISKRDIMEADTHELNEQDKQCISFVDIPWLLLKRLICVNNEYRDITFTKDDTAEINPDLDNPMCFISDMSDESQDISPLDVIHVVFQCLDPFMKQIFFQKSYLCKLAVPLLYKQWETNESYKTILSVWPLRSLVIENRASDTEDVIQSREVDMFQLQTNVLAFSRFGRPCYSKSKLINSLLTNQSCETFYNIDCPSGKTQRYVCTGHIELFWLPTIGDKKDRFHEPVTFLNMRGDINEHFERDVLSFVATFIDVFVILIDVETLLTQTNSVKATLAKFSSVILIIANPLNPEAVKGIQSFKKDVHVSNSEINLRILGTHKGVVELNVVDMVSIMLKHIQNQLKDNKSQSYQQRLSSAKLSNVETDENDKMCQKGRNEAELLVEQMKKGGGSNVWKQVLTPVHCTYSLQLGKIMKDREREKDFAEGENIDQTIKSIREKQTQSVTKSVTLFIDILIRNKKSHLALSYFLYWLHFHIENEKQLILPQLMYANRCAWEKLKLLKSTYSQVEADTEHQETGITDLERKIDEASFTVEHFFREIGHIYEAILQLGLCSTELGLPHLKDISKLIGRLVADGHQFEVIDGESFYMPYLWTKAVLKEVDRCIGSSKVMTLSVLGVQSSGKSTLLNTMFGSQFTTRTGRCTRGIHAQLVPANFARLEEVSSPFSYVLVVDTEGLRSPELSRVQHEHDNELATVITGLGDITMLNIMGENIGEIRDILQVIVHAFLRLKMTNPKLDLRKSCSFIHQNVADTSASENMIRGLRKLMQTLDEMTKESARSEGISNITSFNQVIEFDINSQVWYLKNLWQGNPPMAKVNSEYSERVEDMKCQILNKALTMKDKSYKCLSDILDQAHSLWKGVLNEDFVFSFRNSLEIKAYMEMEKVVQDQLWHLESFIRDELIRIVQSSFANCSRKDNLQSVADTLINELNNVLAEERSKTEEEIKTYFEKNKYKDIIIQWKNSQQCRIDSLCLSLQQVIRQQIGKSQEKRSVEILTVSSHERHEEELRNMSMKVANEYKGKTLSRERKNVLFDEIWNSFMTKVVSSTSTLKTKKTLMKNVFEKCLQNLFQNYHAVIKDALIQSKHLKPMQNIKKLKGSFDSTGINDKDISLTFFQKGKDFFRITDTMEHITTRANQIFEIVDDKILQLCQVNDEITEMAINKLMHELYTSLHEILKGNTKYDFKATFYAKICVHVSRHAHPVFEKHNENYFRTQSTAALLEQYKQQQKISFEAHLSSRLSEDIVAKLFCHVIEGFAKECTLERLPNKITDELYSYLPSVKNRLIVDICSDLLEKNDLDNFIRYIHAPKEYGSLWVTEKANIFLFAKEFRMYYCTANSLLKQIFKAVEESLSVLKDDYIGKTPPSIGKWINDFQLSIKKANLSIPLESFRNLKIEIKYIQNVEFLTHKILEKLTASLEKMMIEFSKHDSNSVKWANSNPIDRIMQKIWGCPEQCPFCGEPCAKNEDHEGSVHYSIQHRPSCCKGSRDRDSNLASLESCDFKIQSELSYNCRTVNFICNRENHESCSKEYHEFRQYKTLFPEWNIPPTSNMHDTSKYWMWFVATYKQDLLKTYGYKVDNIPTSWKDISKQQAKESLMKTYAA